jgi:cytochrome P450 family 6
MICAILCLVLVVLLSILNHFLLNYWSRLGIKQVNGKFLVGSAWSLIVLKVSLGEFFQNIYNNHKDDKCVGVYISYKPVLVITDPLLVQRILIKDFANFSNRPPSVDEVRDPISANLFTVREKKWRKLREKLSPAFSPRRVKAMFPIIRRCAKVLENYLTRNLNEGVNVFEFRELSARYNTNVISSVAFGIENDCINEPDNIFRKMCGKCFDLSLFRRLKETLMFIGCSDIHQKLRFKVIDPNLEKFLFAIFKQTVDYREANNFVRNDFMQLLIQLRNKGFISTSDDEDDNDEDLQLSINEITAHVRLNETETVKILH